jgi:hypothetical protein
MAARSSDSRQSIQLLEDKAIARADVHVSPTRHTPRGEETSTVIQSTHSLFSKFEFLECN